MENNNENIINIPLDDYGDFEIEHVSVDTALIKSIKNKGMVDIEYISQLSSLDPNEVILKLKNSIYQNPEVWNENEYQGYEIADEYLSGNLRRKYEIAIEANKKYNGRFLDNVKRLKDLLPIRLQQDNIYVTLGAPWIPVDIIDSFIRHIVFDVTSSAKRNEYLASFYKPNMGLHYSKNQGVWIIKSKMYYGSKFRRTHNRFASKRFDCVDLIEKCLNGQTAHVYDSIYDTVTNKSTAKLNNEDSIESIHKQEKIIREFQRWIWLDPIRKERILKLYDEKFSSFRKRVYDGSFLTFPGINKNINLYTTQKNAIARIILSPNVLLAHNVGSGKTYIMVASAMELRRMNLSKKNLFVVPNSIISQWENMFLDLYPNAKLLVVNPKAFSRDKTKYLKKIRDEDFDAIIMAHSSFTLIKLHKDFYIQQEQNKINDYYEDDYKIGRFNIYHQAITRNLNRIIDNIPADKPDEIYFEDLNINRLYIDEAHEFKNVPLASKSSTILGINIAGSKKAKDCLNKVRIIQDKNNGGGIVFATGTPITNSIAEIYILQNYLEPSTLNMLGIKNFDNWCQTFAEKRTDYEIDVDTSSYHLVTRFTNFHNIPELTNILALVADFHQLNNIEDDTKFKGYDDIKIEKEKPLEEYLKCISKRCEDVRTAKVNKKEDNLLKITTDGRKAALDIRLVNPNETFSTKSKVNRCIDNVIDFYFKYQTEKYTQLIFCDISIPKINSFNIYDDIKSHLISRGVKAEEIAFIHEGSNEIRKETIFRKTRKGEIRILIGSTTKLGQGVNVQDRLVAIHHLDIPWRPSDMKQREGRILRPGNTSKEVRIFRYITEGSFDAYSWQLLETKQHFIDSILKGEAYDRDYEDISETSLDYGELKALAIGNPKIKEAVEIKNKINEYKILNRKEKEAREDAYIKINEHKTTIKNLIEEIDKCSEDVNFVIDLLSKEEKLKTNNKEESQERKLFRISFFNELTNYTLKNEEKNYTTYRGFEIIFPRNMLLEKPYIYLKRRLTYCIYLGTSDVGNLLRIDNFIDNLDKYLDEKKQSLSILKENRKTLLDKLKTYNSYEFEIAELQAKLNIIEKEIGGKKNGKHN